MKLNWIRGYVRCNLISNMIEHFLNDVMKQNIRLWDISIKHNNKAEFSILVADFFKLRPIVRKSSVKIHILQKIGFPFILQKFKKRVGLIIALFLFIVIVYLLSTLVWTIEVEGNNKIENEIIYQNLNELGIHRGQFIAKLPEQEYIQKQLQAKLLDVSWVGVKVEGTRLKITIVEKTMPGKEEYNEPCNVVSTKDAFIHTILVKKGMSLVNVNDRVKKGDILISGIIGDEEKNEQVAAKGTVMGIVWYKSTGTISLTQNLSEYTGETYERGYLAIGNRMLKIKGFSDDLFSNYQQVSEYKQVYFKNFKLPLGYVKENLLEYEESEKILTESEAFNIIIEQTKKDLCSKMNSTSTIINEKIISKKNQDSKLTVEILYEVLEDITVSQPIIQGE